MVRPTAVAATAVAKPAAGKTAKRKKGSAKRRRPESELHNSRIRRQIWKLKHKRTGESIDPGEIDEKAIQTLEAQLRYQTNSTGGGKRTTTFEDIIDHDLIEIDAEVPDDHGAEDTVEAPRDSIVNEL